MPKEDRNKLLTSNAVHFYTTTQQHSTFHFIFNNKNKKNKNNLLFCYLPVCTLAVSLVYTGGPATLTIAQESPVSLYKG